MAERSSPWAWPAPGALLATLLVAVSAACAGTHPAAASAPACEAKGPPPKGAPPSVHHILLEVASLDASIAFYRDRMGLRLESRSGDFATLEAENMGVYLWQGRWDWELPRRPGSGVGLGIYPHLAVADVDATVTRLRGCGAKIIQEPRRYDWGDEAFVADPDGYIWSLVRMAK